MPPTRGVHPLRTETFRVSRLQLAYLGVAQYVATFWWFVAIIPAFGLIATIFGDGILRVMGLMGLLWPISLPARAIFATSRAGKLMEKGVWASVESGILYLHGESDGLKLSLSYVRRTDRRRGFLVLVFARGAFVGIPLTAAEPTFFDALEADAASERERFLAKPPST